MSLRSSLAHAVRRVLPGKTLARPTPSPCMNCGYRSAVLLGTRVVSDFDTSAILSPGLREAFADRMDGICVRCGIYQSYKRFTLEQLKEINYAGKDITTSEPAYARYPAPAEYVEQFNAKYFGTRTDKWREYFSRLGVRPANAFFIRPNFGASAKFIRDEYSARVAGADMSDVCLRTTEAAVPEFRSFRGAINGMLEGDFLQSGPYDSLFSFHVLVHACDVHEMLEKMGSMLTKDGFVLFTHEVVRKAFNPFHMIHLSEFQLESILLQHFSRVDRIDACDTAQPSVHEYTKKGDNPDFVAWK